MAYTKLALRRDPNVAIGHPSPIHLDCLCGQEVQITGRENCCTCGTVYDSGGWVMIPSSASRTETAAQYATLGRSIPHAS